VFSPGPGIWIIVFGLAGIIVFGLVVIDEQLCVWPLPHPRQEYPDYLVFISVNVQKYTDQVKNSYLHSYGRYLYLPHINIRREQKAKQNVVFIESY
jgi:hypothetical protein